MKNLDSCHFPHTFFSVGLSHISSVVRILKFFHTCVHNNPYQNNPFRDEGRTSLPVARPASRKTGSSENAASKNLSANEDPINQLIKIQEQFGVESPRSR